MIGRMPNPTPRTSMPRVEDTSGDPTGGSIEPRVVTVADTAAMRALGSRLADAALPGDVICLFGDLGAGKTQLAKGFGEGLGI